jgi:hypothetical protein
MMLAGTRQWFKPLFLEEDGFMRIELFHTISSQCTKVFG